jgi:hypothetical protein
MLEASLTTEAASLDGEPVFWQHRIFFKSPSRSTNNNFHNPVVMDGALYDDMHRFKVPAPANQFQNVFGAHPE